MALSGKVAVVTGAAMGIGKAMTKILLQNGATVSLLDINESAGKTLKEALNKQYGKDKTLFLICDVESQEQIKVALKKTVEAFGGIDIVCNNAGNASEADWEKTISVNLLGVIRTTYLAMEHMNQLNGGRGGVIVNTASLAGLGPLFSCPAYTASKHGVVGFTRAMAAASTASGYGIRFNSLCPGLVQTDFFTNLPVILGPFANLIPETQAVINTGSVSPTEVAEGLLKLVTDETKNGEALIVKYNLKGYMKFPLLTQEALGLDEPQHKKTNH